MQLQRRRGELEERAVRAAVAAGRQRHRQWVIVQLGRLQIGNFRACRGQQRAPSQPAVGAMGETGDTGSVTGPSKTNEDVIKHEKKLNHVTDEMSRKYTYTC